MEQLIDREHILSELNKLDLPGFVRELRLTTGEDASGEEALWVWIVVREGSEFDDIDKDELRRIRHRIRSRMADLAPGMWCYIRLDNP